LGIGTATPTTQLHIQLEATNASPTVTVDSIGETSGVKGQFFFKRARGTAALPTAVLANDFLAQFSLQGAYGSNLYDGGRRIFQVEASENWDATHGGFRYAFYTRPNASGLGVPVEAMRLDQNGNVGIGTSGASPTSRLQVVGLPVYANNTEALANGLTAGAFYRTSTGVLMVVY